MADRGVRLFISCVSDEFGAYRDTLRHALTRPNVEVKIQEDFKALGGDTLHALEDYIRQCQAMVHFAGEMTGSTPAGTSVDDLIRRRPQLAARLAEKGLGRDALNTLTYTQWEAWLAIGFDKDLVIVEPADGVPRGPAFAPTDVSRSAQAQHLKRLRAINRYPGPPFTGADNLIATIVNSAVTEALVKARIGPVTEKRQEPFGATIAAVVSGIFVLFIDKLLPLENIFGELPIFVRLLLAVAAGLFAWLAWRYWDILGGAGEAPESRERSDCDALVAELRSGGTPAKVYRDWLTKALDRVDVFFGDAGRNDKSWIARALGLETLGARWTAPAFDRCLLLALVYPVVTIVGVWIWSGHVGVAERAIGLWPTLAHDRFGELTRSAFGLSILAILYAFWRFSKAKGFLSNLLWVGLGAVALALGFAVAGAAAVAVAVAGAVAFEVAFSVAGAGAVAVAVAVALAIVVAGAGAGAVVVAVAVAFAFAGAVTASVRARDALDLADSFDNIFGSPGFGTFFVAVIFSVVFAVVFAVILAFAVAFAGTSVGAVARVAALAVALAIPAGFADAYARNFGRLGRFLSLFFVLMMLIAFAAAWFLSSQQSWGETGIILLLFGVLTLANTPFDWFAIGLTRGLLRRGLAPGGWSPFFYAAVDTIVAPFIIALLAFVTVFAVQTFDDIGVLRAGSGARILPLGPLFEGLEARPADPEYWWLWLMLFSTLIPSALNLSVAAASLIRGLPFLNTWIVRRMTPAGAWRDSDRLLLAGVLSGQIAGGFLATGLALYFIGVWFLPIWLPILGGYVRDFSEAVAAYNAPARIMMWFAGVR